MRFYLKILLLLLPTLLISNEWEKVDLPNLNNGHIENAFFFNNQNIIEKWDGKYLSSNDFKDWAEVDSNYLKNELLKINSIDSSVKFSNELSNIRRSYNKVFLSGYGVLYFNSNDNGMNASNIKFSNYEDLRKNKITTTLEIKNNKITMIESLDNSLYFYIDSSLYSIIDKEFVKTKITNISKYKSELIMFKYNGLLNILHRKESRELFGSSIWTISISNDSLKNGNKIFDSL